MTSTDDDYTAALRRLHDEGEALDALVADLDEAGWATPTPAHGWTVAHQIAHLAWTDEAALAALGGEGSFAPVLAEAMADPLGITDATAAAGAQDAPAELLARWRAGRARLAAALAEADRGARFPWFGPPMKARSMITARVMETWAHGQDVHDALGAAHADSVALLEVAHLGVVTRDFAYRINGEEPPAEPFRIELTAPDGAELAWGPEDSANRVRGGVRDFCLLVTQRREREQLDLVVEGAEADRWADFAQAFAGPPKAAVRAARAAARAAETESKNPAAGTPANPERTPE